MTGAEHEAHESRSHVQRRFVIVGDPSTTSWWPVAWLLLLLLLILFIIGAGVIAPAIEKDVAESAKKSVIAAGYHDLDIVADGQGVSVRGSYAPGEIQNGIENESLEPSSQHSLLTVENTIASVIRGSLCDSFIANDLVCPTKINVELVETSRPELIQPEPPELLQSEEVVEWHDFSVRRKKNKITLLGDVPSIDVRKAALVNARGIDGVEEVIDQLEVSGKKEKDQHQLAWLTVWDIFENLSEGTAFWREGVISLKGNTSAAQSVLVKEAFNRRDDLQLGELDLLLLEEPEDIVVNNCNQKFDAILKTSAIRFKTASANISATSYSTIKALAEVAADCDYTLVIEGHTDNVGADEANLLLSKRRASSVADALNRLGIEYSAITAHGFGAMRPVADNTTAEGQALNRRIEIKVLRPQPSEI